MLERASMAETRFCKIDMHSCIVTSKRFPCRGGFLCFCSPKHQQGFITHFSPHALTDRETCVHAHTSDMKTTINPHASQWQSSIYHRCTPSLPYTSQSTNICKNTPFYPWKYPQKGAKTITFPEILRPHTLKKCKNNLFFGHLCRITYTSYTLILLDIIHWLSILYIELYQIVQSN